MLNPGNWEHKCAERCPISVDSDLEKTTQLEVDRIKFLQQFENKNTFMVSDVIYADELSDIGKINFNANRFQPALFFEVHTFDNKIRYRSASSEEELFKKYSNIKALRQISKENYDTLRAKAVRTNNDDL